MSRVNLLLPDSLHKEVESLARKEGFSIDQFISSAVAEKMSALLTESYLKERALKGDEKSFFKALSKVPGVESSEQDKL